MPVIVALVAGVLAGIGSYVGWLEAIGVTPEVTGVAIAVGVVVFLASLLGISIFVFGEL